MTACPRHRPRACPRVSQCLFHPLPPAPPLPSAPCLHHLPLPLRLQAAGSYWVRDMQQACYSGTHLSLYVPLGVAAVAVFCAGPPAAAFFFVWRIRHRLEEEHIQRMFGFLYKRYK